MIYPSGSAIPVLRWTRAHAALHRAMADGPASVDSLRPYMDDLAAARREYVAHLRANGLEWAA